MSRANRVWRDIASGDEVLILFREADAYISPNWYASKHEHDRQVPTWNYIVVHAQGHDAVADAMSERVAERSDAAVP